MLTLYSRFLTNKENFSYVPILKNVIFIKNR